MARRTTAEIHDKVRDMMVSALQAGTVPWHKPWTTKAGTTTRPTSLASRKPYRGTNVWVLGLTALEHGYTSPWWGTYNQLAQLSGMVKAQNPKTGRWGWASPDGTPRGVRAGEKSTEIIFSKKMTVKDRDSDDPDATKQIFALRTFHVFNACQADALPERYYGLQPVEDADAEIAELADAQAVIDAYIANGGPDLHHVYGDRAYYTPDKIIVPERKQFATVEEYYSTLFHEAGHSTGHPKRLNRPGAPGNAEWDHFGTQKYSREELAAEMIAAMLCALTGVEGTFDNSANYIASWIRVLKGDSDMVIDAASQAQAAVDLILADEATEVDDDESEALAA